MGRQPENLCGNKLTLRHIIIRSRRSRSPAAYCDQTFPWTICRSVRRSVQCIVKNGESDPDAVWYHRSDGSRDEADGGVWRSVPGKGTFRGSFGARHCNQWRLYGVGVRQCLNRRSCGLGWCVVGQGIAVLDGVHVVQGEGDILGFLFPVFTMGNAIWSPTVKCFRFVCENLPTFPFSKRIIGKLDSWAFWRYIHFQDQSWGL